MLTFKLPNTYPLLIITVAVFFVAGCKKDSEVSEEPVYDPNSWNLPEEFITGVYSPFNFVENPEYHTKADAGFLVDNELVLAYKGTNHIYIYPVNAMVVEAVNEVIDGVPLTITYCPITRSGVCWNRVLGEDTLDITASGYLYKNNLMPVDLRSESIFSQMRLSGVRGKYKGRSINTLPLIETRWDIIKNAFPDADFKIFDNANFKASTPLKSSQLDIDPGVDSLLQNTERAFGIVGNPGTDIYRFSLFSEGVRVFESNIEMKRTFIVGSAEHGMITAFYHDSHMTAVQDAFPVIMEDASGSKWNIFGEAVSGPRKGEKLGSPPSYMAMGWAWKQLFDNLTVIE